MARQCPKDWKTRLANSRRPRWDVAAIAVFLVSWPATTNQATAQASTALNTSETTSPQVRDFSVTTTIFDDATGQPVSVHQMLHQGGVSCDLPHTDSRFVTLLDLAKSRLTMLDRRSQVRCDLATESLLHIAAAAVSEITDPASRQRLGLLAEVRTVDDCQLHIEFPGVRYDVTAAAAPDPHAAIAYGQFVDWMCRLTMVRPSGMPPFARMKLNERLVQHQQIAAVTTLTLGAPGDRPMSYHSESKWKLELDADAVRQLDEVAGMLALYRDVPWNEFPRPE